MNNQLFTQKEENLLQKNEFWFRFYLHLPTILTVFWAVACLAVGITLSIVIDELYALCILGVVLCPLVYAVGKISFSQAVLQIYLLKKISLQQGGAPNVQYVPAQPSEAAIPCNTPTQVPVQPTLITVIKEEIPEEEPANIATPVTTVAKKKSFSVGEFLKKIGVKKDLTANNFVPLIGALLLGIFGFIMLSINVYTYEHQFKTFYDYYAFNGYDLLSFDSSELELWRPFC